MYNIPDFDTTLYNFSGFDLAKANLFGNKLEVQNLFVIFNRCAKRRVIKITDINVENAIFYILWKIYFTGIELFMIQSTTQQRKMINKKWKQ